MGMYDELLIEFALPEKYKKYQGECFQTKSLQNRTDLYKIDRNGQLWFAKASWELLPEEERPNYGKPEWNTPMGKIFGSMKIKTEKPLKCKYTGEIRFYTYLTEPLSFNETWLEITSFFYNGKMMFFKILEQDL